MVELGYSFRNTDDLRGTPIYRADADDFTAIGALYDRLRQNFEGISLSFHSCPSPVCIPQTTLPPVRDGAALQDCLAAVSNDPLDAYVVSLNGQSLAVLIDYAQSLARRDGPSFGSDIDGSRSSCRDTRFEIMETEKTKIKSITIAENLEAVADKFKLYAWQWEDGDAVRLMPGQVSPYRMQRLLVCRLTRFAQRAQQAKLG